MVFSEISEYTQPFATVANRPFPDVGSVMIEDRDTDMYLVYAEGGESFLEEFDLCEVDMTIEELLETRIDTNVPL